MKTISLALVLASVACGTATDDGKTHPAASNPEPSAPAAGSAARTVSVQLAGVRASGSVRVRAATLEVSVDGHAVPAQLRDGELALGNDQPPWALAAFDLPAEAQRVAISLQFRPEGIVERAGKTQALDLSGPPLSWVADAAQVRTQKGVVLEIDLGRSVIDRCERVFLLPVVSVR